MLLALRDVIGHYTAENGDRSAPSRTGPDEERKPVWPLPCRCNREEKTWRVKCPVRQTTRTAFDLTLYESLEWKGDSWRVPKTAGAGRPQAPTRRITPKSLGIRDAKQQRVKKNTSTASAAPGARPCTLAKQPLYLQRAASFRTVFQFRPVPRTPSVFSIWVLVNFERPIPVG